MKTKRTIRNCDKQFKFICPMEWESLDLTKDDGIRHCEQCSRNVYFCITDEETIDHAKAGHCIARELPEQDELPVVYLGVPEALPEYTPNEIEAMEWGRREAAIDDSIRNADSIRACPKCKFPAPTWRVACRICGLEFGRYKV